jgi:hypothetical protein
MDNDVRDLKTLSRDESEENSDLLSLLELDADVLRKISSATQVRVSSRLQFEDIHSTAFLK